MGCRALQREERMDEIIVCLCGDWGWSSMGNLEVRRGDLGTLASEQTGKVCHGMLSGRPYVGCSGVVIREMVVIAAVVCGGGHVKCELFPEGQLGVSVVWETVEFSLVF